MRWAFVAAVPILIWRGVSLWEATDLWFALTMNGVGLVFLVVGLDTVYGQRFASSGLAGAYLLCQSLHWGGPVTIGQQTASIVFYLLVSGALAHAFLLHFALSVSRWEVKLWQRTLIYGPVALAGLLGSGLALSLYGPDSFMAVHVVQDNLYAVLALLVLLARPGQPRWFGVALVTGWLPPLLIATIGTVDIAGRGPEPANVLYVAIPIGFALVQRMAVRNAS